MKNLRAVSILTVLIALFSLTAAIAGIFSGGGPGRYVFTTVHGEAVTIYGSGIYRYDSVSMAAQAIAQDIVTLILGIPLLAVALFLSRKGFLKGRILLAGTLAYFLYTYTSYSFTSMYNILFLLDVCLMSMSFFAFVLTMMSFDMNVLSRSFDEKLPVKSIAAILIFLGSVIGLMWLKNIVTPLFTASVPLGLEQYTTMVIQAMDLGFVVPVSLISGILLLKKKPFGILLASVICVKAVTLLTAVTAMIIGQIISGLKVSVIEIILFPAFNLIMIATMFVFLRNIKETEKI